jgi:hypothetical protein
MFFRIYTVFYILFYSYMTFNPKNVVHYGVWEWVDIVMMIISLCGMAAYTFHVRILIRKFWDYYVYLFIIFELVYMTWLQFPLFEKLGLTDYIAINNLINILMMLPIVYALFRLPQRWETWFSAPVEKSVP